MFGKKTELTLRDHFLSNKGQSTPEMKKKRRELRIAIAKRFGGYVNNMKDINVFVKYPAISLAEAQLNFILFYRYRPIYYNFSLRRQKPNSFRVGFLFNPCNFKKLPIVEEMADTGRWKGYAQWLGRSLVHDTYFFVNWLTPNIHPWSGSKQYLEFGLTTRLFNLRYPQIKFVPEIGFRSLKVFEPNWKRDFYYGISGQITIIDLKFQYLRRKKYKPEFSIGLTWATGNLVEALWNTLSGNSQ